MKNFSDPYRFALLAHAPELVNHVYEAVQGATDVLRYEYVDFDTGPALAKSCLETGSEVILCHGGTGDAIVRALGHSVVTIDRTDMDLIKALRQAKKISGQVILAAHRGEWHDLEEVEDLLQLKIRHISYETREHMFEEVRGAYADGLRVLVGGGISKQCIEELGGIGLVIEPNPHSVGKALERARLMVYSKRQEKTRLDNLIEIFSQFQEGAVCIDDKDGLVFANPLAMRLLNLPMQSGNETLMPFYEPLGLREVLNTMAPKQDNVVNMAGESFFVRSYPLASMHEGTRMAVAFFRDIPTLRTINRKLEDALYRNGFVARTDLGDIIGISKPAEEMKTKIRRFAQVDATVLICGETGTGKELAAHALHQESARSKRPFVAVNLAALAPNLIESTLFGYDEGAFTGAKRGGKMGLFEMADKGTLFLDEVGEISHDLQLRLLRVLESREAMRVGGNRIFSVDVRVLSASHRPLPEMVREGTFRKDLYYRLAILKLNMPPLRERGEDIPLIIDKMLKRYAKPPLVFSPAMMEVLQHREWPGNIRELLALVERYLILLNGNKPDPQLFRSVIEGDDELPKEPQARETLWIPTVALKDTLDALKIRICREAVAYCQGNKQDAALKLGISSTTLWRVLDRKNTPVTLPFSL